MNIPFINMKEGSNLEEDYNLERFITAQESDYPLALSEIKKGHKTSCWMWYIFPQICGLAKSDTAVFYGIKNLDEARAFLSHPYLGHNLIEISHELCKLETTDSKGIFGYTDDKKLKSSMTLFSFISDDNNIFTGVLNKFYGGEKDRRTLEILKLQDM